MPKVASMTPDFLRTAPDAPRATLLLTHGAGAPMDTPFMAEATEALVRARLNVVRFEFAYMAARRSGGPRRPPPRVDRLAAEFHDAVAALPDTPLLIGGKSMGGRVASMIADDLFRAGRIAGVICLGYPFHAPGKPDTPRIAHLAELITPGLICQGSRDPFGTRQEVETYALSHGVRLAWFEDGDHDLTPRKRQTGLTRADHMARLSNVVDDWCRASGL